jgi:anthranilate phosphoribosyltransferase
VNLQLSPQQVAECIEKIGVGFMFAPAHHSAMKHAIGPRKEMGVRTIFNMLGPLTNPAAAPNQVMGVFAEHLLEPFANVLAKLGSRHVMVVRSDDGMDEISISAATQVAELKDGKIRRYSITPEQFGIARHDIAELAVDSVEQSLKIMRAVLSGQSGPASDIVALNAGAAIYTAGLVKDLEAGVQRAQEIIDSGDGRAKLDALVALTQSFK